MLFADGTVGLLLFGLWVFCLIDVITTDEGAIRNLPKIVWLLVVLLLPDIGSLAWLIAGRAWSGAGSGPQAGRRVRATTSAGFPEYDRPGRHVAANPEDDEKFLAQVRERAEAQRRQYQVKRQAELEAEHDRLHRRPNGDLNP